MNESVNLRGRAVPLRALRDAFAAASRGRGRIVVLGGEAGIGKSALASTLADEAVRHGAEVTWGRAWEFADAPPYFPLLPCLRRLDLDVGEAANDTSAFALWERVLSQLSRVSAERTIVWLLEDLHAADLGTLDLLTFLGQPIRAMRVLVVVTLRPHDPRVGERQLQRIARLARDGLEIRVEPLVEADVAAVTADTLGHDVPADVVQRLVELTGGNPLFVVECARAVRAGGIERMIAALPPTVRQIVLERVALLPEATRRVLEAGAILGRELSAATVARMLDATPARVIDELVPALRAGVVREVRSGSFVFSHVLVRDAIDDALGEDVRARLHAAADAALAALGDSAEILVERARHALATRGGDPAHAVDVIRRATELLEREGAFDRAFELHARAAERRAAGFLPPASAEDKLRVATVAREAGRGDEMRRWCEDVIVDARTRRDGELFAKAVLLHATDVRAGVIDALQISLLEEVLPMLDEHGPTACRVMARLATALMPTIHYARPNQIARDALQKAHALGDDAAILDVLDLGALGCFGTPRDERLAWARELHDRATRAGDHRKALNALSQLAMWEIEAGNFAEFAEARTSALALSEGLHPRHRWDSLMLASGHACALGRFGESDRYLTEVSQIAALVDDPSLKFVPFAHELARAKLRRRPDELATAFPAFDEIATRLLWRGGQFAAAVGAGAFARVGDVDRVRAVLLTVDADARFLEPDIEAMASLGEALALVGDDARRRRARDVLSASPYTDLFGFGVSYMYEGTVERIVGLLDAALGDLDAAESRLRHSLALARERAHAPWVAQLAQELAAVLSRRAVGDEVRALRDEAKAIARSLGMDGARHDEPDPRTLRLVRNGDVWTIERGTATARIKDSRGVQLLARLAERPNEEIHVLALASDESAPAPESSTRGRRDGIDAIDASARKAYQKRLAELADALAIAESAGNAAAATRLEREQAAIVRELSRASGLGGRTRQTGSATERARINVQRRLKEVIGRVAETNTELGAFLEAAIRTGTFCCFRP